VEDLAFAVARFFQRGGTFNNYYMVMQPYMMFKAFLTLSYSRCLENELMPQLFLVASKTVPWRDELWPGFWWAFCC